MNILAIFILTLIPGTFQSFIPATSSKQSLALLKTIATSSIAKEWVDKLGDRFEIIKTISKVFIDSGLLENVVSVILKVPEELHNESISYLKNITEQLDKIDAKLDDISQQINLLDAKLSQSTKKIITEVKLRDLIQHIEDILASKQLFESIISSFVSNSTSLLIQLDTFIDDYRQRNSETKLVNILDSSIGFSNSIIDDIISLGRSYHNDNFGSSGSSTMKAIYDVYITALMTVLRGNIILDSAVNLKSTITGNYYEEDRRFNHYRKNDVLKSLFASLERTFNKLDDRDMDGFIDLTYNGDKNPVRMINVLQYFWENEDKLSIIDTCTDNCEHFVNRKYNGGGCEGAVRDCKFGVKIHHTERNLRQNPQIDRIYLGYVLNHKWYGYGVDDELDFDMEQKKSYPRGFVVCHVCKCMCDQYSNSDSVRKIYTGKMMAPDGYVVTGIKFIECNKAIYPLIQVGKLLPMATIEQNSIHWLDIPSDDNFDTFNYDNHEFKFGDPSDLTVPNGVVTGVQFKSTSSGVSWSIYGKELTDFNGGLLGDVQHIETTKTNSYLNAFDLIPKLSGNREYFIEKSKTIDFGISNEDKDAGQSFVPYFDGTEVTFDVKAPLSGIALVHYTNSQDYAGYIRPVIRSLDYRKFFTTFYQIEPFIPAKGFISI